MVDCIAKLCDNYLKRVIKLMAVHFSQCINQWSRLTTYGVCNSKSMFFEAPCSSSSRPCLESASTELVHVTGGSLLEEQVLQQLKRLVLAEFRWTLVLTEDNFFKVE